MKKSVIVFFLLGIFLYAGNNSRYQQKDLVTLKQLNIEKSFLKDKELKQIFKRYSRNSHLHYYVKNIKEASVYISVIQDILKKQKIPSSFLAIPMAESNFKIRVKSSANAVGYWQFIPNTAKLFNLKNNRYIDERLDFVKSTKAAIKYLNQYHKKFDKWYMAIIAYNCGQGRMIEAITRAKLDKYVKIYPKKAKTEKIQNYRKIINDYIKTKKNFYKVNKIYKKLRKLNIKLTINDLFKSQKNIDRQYLPKESRVYLKKTIAFAMLINRNFYEKSKLFNKKSSYTTIRVKGGQRLKSLAKINKISYKKLKNWNLHIKKGVIPKNLRYYDINIPKNKVSRVYKVKKGDTLSQIAVKFKKTQKEIKKINRLKSDKLLVNQKLYISN